MYKINQIEFLTRNTKTNLTRNSDQVGFTIFMKNEMAETQ
jgi:hypothetical protein